MKIKAYWLVMLLTFPLFGGEVNLKLKEALKILKDKNLEIKVAKFDSQMKKIESKLPNLSRLGKIDATLMAMRSNDAGNVFGFKLQSREASFADFGFNDQAMEQIQKGKYSYQPSGLNYPDARNHYLTKFTYQVPVFTAGKITLYSDIAHKMYDMSLIDRDKVVAQKVYETKKTFYDITLVENYIANLIKINKNIDELTKIVQEMVKEGFAIQTDLLEVQAHQAEAKSMLIQAQLNREVAYEYLSFLLDSDVDSIEKVNEIAPLNMPTKKEILSNSYDVQKALIGLEITKDMVWVQRTSYLPTIGAFAEYGSADNSIFNDFRNKDFYTIGLQANWTLFNGFQDSLNIQKAKIENYKTMAQVEMAKKGTELKVKKLQSEALSNLEMIKSNEASYRLAHQVYENYLAKYKEGLSPVGDVIMKQSKELEALLQLQTTKNSYNAKAFELESILKQGEQNEE